MAKIMLIDEDARISQFIKLKLTNRNNIVSTFTNGLNAWESLEKERPDIIVSEVMLPGISGFELIEKLKSDTNFQKLPFIFLSSVSMEDDIVRGLELGANDYITKPFNFAELSARIKKCI